MPTLRLLSAVVVVMWIMLNSSEVECCQAQDPRRGTLEAAELAFLGTLSSSESGADSENAKATNAEQFEEKALTIQQLDAKAVQGSGFGVMTLTISQPPRSLRLESIDATLELQADDCRIWLPATRVTRYDNAGRAQEVKVYGLFDAGVPRSIDLYLSGRKLLEEPIVVHKSEHSLDEPAAAKETLRWWEAFSRQSDRLAPDELRGTNRHLLAALGNHLGGLPRIQPVRGPSTSQLEKEFERTIGMLLGFESVRLAMMTEDRSLQTDDTPVSLNVPGSLNVAAVRLPSHAKLKEVVVPSITRLIPPDCYMVRCKSLENYNWLRSLLIDWGGSLDDIVAGNLIQSEIRPRLEEQLALSAAALTNSGGDQLIQDLAIIGSDLLFENGAGVGVLIQARPNSLPKLQQILDAQRSAAGGVLQQTRVDGLPVSYLHESGNQLRSFMLMIDDCILVTNSTEITRSVIRAKKSRASLGDLNEFKYAMTTNPEGRKSEILFYLSDPFFRRIASAPFRIELSRRRAAAADCRELAAAMLVAESTGNKAETTSALIEKQFIPENFGMRSDGSTVGIFGGEVMDTLRGKRGTFVPVVDIHVPRCNATEQQAYATFSQRYRSEWQVMDPVFATLDAFPIDDEQERLNLSVHITPYARGEYEFLTQYLKSPTQTYLTAGPDELMGVSANLSQGRTTYNAHLGLMDQALEFDVADGQVLINGEVRRDLFAKDSSFAVVTPARTEGLYALNGLMKSLQQRRPIKVPNRSSAGTRSITVPNGAHRFSLLRSFFHTEDMLVQAGLVVFDGMLNMSALPSFSQDGQWAIYSPDQDIHSKLRQDLVIRESLLPAEIHAFVRDIEDSQIYRYLNAYSFCASRTKSAKVAAWLNLWCNGLNANPSAFLQAIESVEQGRVTCPLGGEWSLVQISEANEGLSDKKSSSDQSDTLRWTSSAWTESSLSSVDKAPADYQHRFFQWFQEMELQFSLNNTSLDSNIQVTYKPSHSVRANEVIGESPLAGMSSDTTGTTQTRMSFESVAPSLESSQPESLSAWPVDLELSSSSDFMSRKPPFQVGDRTAIRQILPKRKTDRSSVSHRSFDSAQHASATTLGRSSLFPPAGAPEATSLEVNSVAQSNIQGGLTGRGQRVRYSSEIGIRINTSTMTVSAVKQGLPASRSTLRVGDKILAVNGASISGTDELRSRLSLASQTRSSVTLRVERQRRQIFVQINFTPLPNTDL